MNADTLVYVYNDAQEPLTARWDGKDYTLCSDPVRVLYGVVEHWRKAHKVELRAETIPADEIAVKPIVNPLEENDRGEAFATIKRGRKPKAEG
ncbi:hypothetical protein MO973_19565 [Paenibacillus sp. TRM 82003]|nr:hypothetical protein [Paenibacillus sp. TRM 82003]